MPHERSRRRFEKYRRELIEKRKNGKPPRDDRGLVRRETPRSFWRLLVEFWRMLKGHRGPVVFALFTLTIATLLSLVPPVATKLTIDNVLEGKPLKAPWTSILPHPDSRLQLLWWLALGVMVISIAETLIRLGGRWYATRTVNKVQVETRRRAFEHAVRLPSASRASDQERRRGQYPPRRRGQRRRVDLQHALQPLAGRDPARGQPDHPGNDRLAAIARLADPAAGGRADASHLDRPHSPAAPRHSPAAAGHRQQRHRKLLPACAWCGRLAGSAAKQAASRAAITSWPASNFTPGGGPASSKSSGKSSCRWPRPRCCCTAARKCSKANSRWVN